MLKSDMKLYQSVLDISPTHWNQDTSNVFLNHTFLQTMEESGCFGNERGWQPIIIEEESSLLYSFSKTHSYGEYIFDWSWANAYHQNGYDYYPKLTSMIPFTPATTNHIIGENKDAVFKSYQDFFEKGYHTSSHFLFLTEQEVSFFQAKNYLIRDSIQYHFFNRDYLDFSHFLQTLKSRKVKNIKKERASLKHLEIKKLTGDELTENHAKLMYKFYRNTTHEKNAIAYLTQDFFVNIFKNMKQNIFFALALDQNIPIAGALYFFDHERIYGRYWGCLKPQINLHFELCYYQGIEFCIHQKLKVFEAGAQGEHKIARGFEVIKTKSAHQLKNKMFHQAIENFIQDESRQLDEIILELNRLLPYKNGDT